MQFVDLFTYQQIKQIVVMQGKKKIAKPIIKSIINFVQKNTQNAKEQFIVKSNINKTVRQQFEISSQQIRQLKPVASQNEHVVVSKKEGKGDLRRLCPTPGESPYSAIGYLYLAFTNGVRGFGTGFLIKPYVILTAAHNLYNRSERVNVQYVILHMAEHMQQQRKRYLTVCAFIPREYKQLQIENDARQFDFAIIIIRPDQQIGEIKQQFAVLRLNHFQIKENDEVYVYGYPDDLSVKQYNEDSKKGFKSQQKYLFGCKNIIEKVHERVVIHHVDTAAGQSGAPIFRWSFIYDSYEVVGIHTQGFGKNKGVKITKEIINRIQQWVLAFHKRQNNEERVMFGQQSCLTQMKVNPIFQQQKMNVQKDSANLFEMGEYQQQKNFELRKGMDFYQKALKIYQSTNEEKSLGCSSVLHRMGTIYQNQGKYESALQCYKRLLVIYEQIFGKKSLNYAITLGNIGVVYGNQKMYEQAKLCHNQSLVITQEKYGKQHYQCVQVINNIAIIESNLENIDEAIQLLERALLIALNHYGATHIKCTLYLNNLGNNYRIKGNINKAKELLQRALSIFEYNKIEKHQNLANTFRQMANVFRDQGKLSEAVQFWKHSAKIFQQVYGPENKNKNYRQVHKLIKKYQKLIITK